MALLTFTPTVTRLLAASASGGAWIEMCTMSGLTWVKVPNSDATGSLTPVGGADHDCAYCPLINAMTALVLLVLAVFPRVRALAVTALRSLPRRLAARPGGLGSRGPPVFA